MANVIKTDQQIIQEAYDHLIEMSDNSFKAYLEGGSLSDFYHGKSSGFSHAAESFRTSTVIMDSIEMVSPQETLYEKNLNQRVDKAIAYKVERVEKQKFLKENPSHYV